MPYCTDRGELIFEHGLPSGKPIEGSDIVNAISEAVLEGFGEDVLERVKLSLLQFNKKAQLFALRCARDALNDVRMAISLVSQLKGKPVIGRQSKSRIQHEESDQYAITTCIC